MRTLVMALSALVCVAATPMGVLAHSGYDALRHSLAVPVLVDGAWTFPTRPARPRAAVEDYSAAIAEACAYYGCNPGYLESVMACESGGDPNAIAYNPASGNYTYGIFQIDAMWGGDAMTPVEQIWFAAEHLTKGDVWWACG
jgi:hypothetical protein